MHWVRVEGGEQKERWVRLNVSEVKDINHKDVGHLFYIIYLL